MDIKDLGVTRMRADNCPSCGKVVTAASPIRKEGAMPSKGDLTVCLGCGYISIFDERLRLQRATPDDLMACDVRGIFDLLWSSYCSRFGRDLMKETDHAHDA